MPHSTCAVIIATRNRPKWLARTVHSVDVAAVDCIVVVDQSDELYREDNRTAVEMIDRVVYIDSPIDGLPAARNRGIAVGQEDVLLFFDDDVHIFEGCIAAHMSAYEDPSVGAVVGRIAETVVKSNRRDVGNRMNRLGLLRTNLWGTSAQVVDAVKGANMSFRRAALDEVGGFDGSYGGTAYLEEVDVSERLRALGWTILFEPKAEVVHFSAPAGGVRVGSQQQTERWRFQNTGYFLGKHRSLMDGGLGHLTYSAVALKRGLEWRDPLAAGKLMRALLAGWREGRSASGTK